MTLPLCEGGQSQKLEAKSAHQYIERVVEVFRNKLFTQPLKWFKSGFNEVLPMSRLKLFDSKEIELLYCGADIEEYWTPAHLRAAIVPSHGFTSESMTFIYLQQYMQTLDSAMRIKFLTFVTGS